MNEAASRLITLIFVFYFDTANDVLFPSELSFKAHLTLQLSLAVMLPQKGNIPPSCGSDRIFLA